MAKATSKTPSKKTSKVKSSKKEASLITIESFEFLKNLLNTPSPTGFETPGQKLWLNYINQFTHSCFTDAYGSAVSVINPDAPFKVVLEAHADEISWFVNYITADGLIYLKRNGGVDHQIAPAMRVFIHGKNGPVKAIFGWPAIHTRLSNPEQKEPQPKVDNLFLDCGARNKEDVAKLGIAIGDVVTYQDGFDELANDYYIGRAMDNRIGGFMIAEVARLIKENNVKLPFGLYFVNAVQEEIGLRGAEMIARRIKPDAAIVTDVTHDTTTPLINKIIEGEIACGKGPSMAFGPSVHNKLLQHILKAAEKNNIPTQNRAVSRSTGTDTDSFAYANDGCPSALISIPLRYMHTTVEMLHKSDIENTIKLMYHSVISLTPKTSLSYFD